MTAEETVKTAEAAPRLVGDVRPGRAALDVVAQLVGRSANVVLGIVAAAALARGLGESRYGVWTTVLLVPSLIGNLVDLGFSQVAVRMAASEDEPRWIGAMVTLRAALTLPTLVLTLVVLLFVGSGGEMLTAGAIVAAQALLGAPAALVSVFQVRIRNDLAMVMLTLNSVLWTTAVVVLMAAGSGLVALAIALIAISTVAVGAQAVLALRQVAVPLRGTRELWGLLVRMAIPVGISGLLIVAYGRIDGVIVYKAAGAVDAGLYGSVYRILDQAEFIPMSLTITLAPMVARLLPARHDEGRALLQLALDLLAMAALFAIAFSLVASHEIVTFLYGAEFGPAAGTLPILMLVFALTCAGYTFGMYTLVLDLQKRFAVYAAIGLVVNVALNVWLVPRHGYRASAWATVVTEATVTGLIARDVLWCLQMRPRFGRFARVAVAAATSAGATALLQRAGVGLLLLLPAALAVHTGLVMGLRALTPTDVRRLLAKDPLGLA